MSGKMGGGGEGTDCIYGEEEECKLHGGGARGRGHSKCGVGISGRLAGPGPVTGGSHAAVL
jgi:hypothetical protein